MNSFRHAPAVVRSPCIVNASPHLPGAKSSAWTWAWISANPYLSISCAPGGGAESRVGGQPAVRHASASVIATALIRRVHIAPESVPGDAVRRCRLTHSAIRTLGRCSMSWKQKCTGCHGEVTSMKGWRAIRAIRRSQRRRDLEQRIQACCRPRIAPAVHGAHGGIERNSDFPSVSTADTPAPLYFERQGQLNLACALSRRELARSLLEPISRANRPTGPHIARVAIAGLLRRCARATSGFAPRCRPSAATTWWRSSSTSPLGPRASKRAFRACGASVTGHPRRRRRRQ